MMDSVEHVFQESLAWIWNKHSTNWHALEMQTVSNLLDGLLYGYGHYTSFCWPLTEEQWQKHWYRLCRDSQYLGLSYEQTQREAFYQGFIELSHSKLCSKPCRFRLSHLTNVRGFHEIIQDSSLKTDWLLTAQPLPKTLPNPKPVHLQIVPFHRHHASIKHMQIAEILFERRQLVQSQPLNEESFDILLSYQKNQTTVLLESGFANLLLLDLKSREAITPDPKQWPCLIGITIANVMETLSKQGWQTIWNEISMDRLNENSLLFLTNAVQGVVPVEVISDEMSKRIWQPAMIKTYEDILAL